MRETTELFLKATPENLARLGELLVHAYQEKTWPTTGLQKVKIFFQETDVTMYQLCDGEEAICHSVLLEERNSLEPNQESVDAAKSYKLNFHPSGLVEKCLDEAMKAKEAKYPTAPELHHTQICIEVTKEWDNATQKRLDKRRYAIHRDEWYCYPASETLEGALQNMIKEVKTQENAKPKPI